MQIHQLKNKNKSQKRIGRGGKRGASSGRGTKGQLSRAGHKKAPVIRELIKKYHKLRGYRFSPVSEKPVTINLNQIKDDIKEVTPETLIEKGIIRKVKGKTPKVKILGDGSIDRPIVVKDCLLSQSAIKKIEKSGGKIL